MNRSAARAAGTARAVLLAAALAAACLGGAAAAARAEDGVPEAEAAWALGDRARAGEIVREYVRLHPESVRSVRVAALLARTAADPTEAAGRWDEVLAIQPDGPLAAEALWQRGLYAYSAGLYVAAGREFGRLAEEHARDFDRGRARLWQAHAEMGADRPEVATELYRQAEGEAKEALDVRTAELGQAHAAFRLGRVREALRRYERFEQDHGDDPRASAAARREVECLRLLGRESDAARNAARIEREYPDSREATLARAEIRAQGREDEPVEIEETGDPEAAAPAGPWIVQAAAMADPRNASTLRRAIRELGIGEVTIEPGESPEGPVHRVLVGPYGSEAEAQAAARAVASLGDLSPRVRALPPADGANGRAASGRP